MPESEEEEQEIENLFQKIVKENFHNLVKEIDIQVQEHRESQRKWIQRGTQQDMPQLKCQKLKIKRILKAVREKESLPTKEFP